MSTRFLIFIALISMCFSQCIKPSDCDQSREENLGHIEYTDSLLNAKLGNETDSLIFMNQDSSISFVNAHLDHPSDNRLNDYLICESIDIDPYRAYAYYTYDNIANIFNSDSMLIEIDPGLGQRWGTITESIYMTLSYGVSESIKGRVPITNVDTTISYEPFDELFEYRSNITLAGDKYHDIWTFEKGKSGIYYSYINGIVGIKVNNQVYVRR